MYAVCLDAPGCQFDRERHPVKSATQVGHDWRFLIAEVQLGAAGTGPLDEELDRRERPDGFGRQLRAIGRTSQGVQPIDIFSLGLESLAARRQDVDVRGAGKDRRCERGHRLDQMFAGVEYQQKPLVAEVGHDARRRIV
jgi:hypothetical protein